MDKYIYTNKTSLSSELCNDIIQLFEIENKKYEGVTAAGLNKNIKNTMDFVIPKDNNKWYKIYNFLSKELQYNIKEYLNNLNNNDEYKNINQDTNITYKFFDNNKYYIHNFMVQRYNRNEGKYVYHNDFMIDHKKKQNRIITYLWYLNDVIEGGETTFHSGEIKINPEIGKLILFPACWSYPHCGKMPLSSSKYIITGWIYIDY